MITIVFLETCLKLKATQLLLSFVVIFVVTGRFFDYIALLSFNKFYLLTSEVYISRLQVRHQYYLFTVVCSELSDNHFFYWNVPKIESHSIASKSKTRRKNRILFELNKQNC